jgi:aspartyl-tRNA(Asn)/glutamyl-tRNA(Gln) amidotransferase subunit A
MDAWGHGSTSENTDYGPVKNPWDTTRVAGGSSGGSAVAVATRMSAFAIGEDTGGSIRNPASMCNIAGLKVTYGRVSRYGSIAYASSLDSVGPMAKSAADIAEVLGVIAGSDPKDATSSHREVPSYSTLLSKPLRGTRIGIPKEFLAEGLESEVRRILDDSIKTFESLGAEIVPVSIPSLSYAVAIYYLIAMSETSSNLNRYDGVRFGNPREFFSEETMRRIIVGTYALRAGYHDELYTRAVKGRTILIREFDELFKVCDAIIGPTLPSTPFLQGDLSEDSVKMFLADIFTVPVNLVGVPSLALPAGFSEDGLPIGIQLIGKKFDEATLLSLGHAYERATDWHLRKPNGNT